MPPPTTEVVMATPRYIAKLCLQHHQAKLPLVVNTTGHLMQQKNKKLILQLVLKLDALLLHAAPEAQWY